LRPKEDIEGMKKKNRKKIKIERKTKERKNKVRN
jgi:hypothetical protein